MMKVVSRVALLLVLVAVLATPALAQQKGKKGNRRKGGQNRNAVMGQLIAKLKGVELSEEQKKKIGTIVDENRKQLQEANAKMKLTAEQRKAGTEARAKAKQDGLKGKEAQAAVSAAMKLTEEQEKARQAAQELRITITKQVLAVLTPEQIEKAGIRKPRGQGGRKKRNK